MTDFADLDRVMSDVRRALGGESLKQGLEVACKPVVDSARRNAPVDSGALRNSIQMLTFSEGTSASAIVEVSDSGQGGAHRNAVFAEFGTSKQHATPFMRPALYKNKSAIVQKMGEHIANQLK